jgi:hypothetical protein
MKVVILQSNYIPWKGYFDLINDADIFCFLDEVQYTKNDWRNRNKLYSKNGLFWLTIPISKKAVNLKISEVILENSYWQEKHYTSIVKTYCKAPQLHNLLPFLEDIYLKQQWKSLSELNQYIIKKICNFIDIKTKIVTSKDYHLESNKIDRIISLIKQMGGTEYISGMGAKNYLDGSEGIFTQNDISLVYKTYGYYKAYPQNLPDFQDAVSIIDTLMFVKQENVFDHITSKSSIKHQ